MMLEPLSFSALQRALTVTFCRLGRRNYWIDPTSSAATAARPGDDTIV
jgi:hypothetical protein